jgi:hypothetical protein
MSCWLDYQSAYFHSLNLTSGQSETVQSLIDSAIEWVEKYCRRSFAKAEHEAIFTVLQDGSIVLDSPPIEHIARLCVASGGWLTVENTSATVSNATYSVSDTGLITNHWASGVRATNTLLFADYPTLTTLAAAIVAIGVGWSADITSGYTLYPSADLVSGQHGNAKTENTIYSWDDYAGSLDTGDIANGILELYLPRGYKVRATYTGGYIDVPEPIKLATANLVISAYQGAEGRIESESLGGYSYTLASVDSLPMNDIKTLAYYRDRRI